MKIGTAKNVDKRMGSLQTGNPEELTLLHTLIGGRKLERQLHRQFSAHHVKGEWFQAEPVEAWLQQKGTP